MKDDEILTIEELSKFLKISKSTLYKLVQGGKFPGTKIGKRWRFHKDTVIDWIKEYPKNTKGKKKG